MTRPDNLAPIGVDGADADNTLELGAEEGPLVAVEVAGPRDAVESLTGRQQHVRRARAPFRQRGRQIAPCLLVLTVQSGEIARRVLLAERLVALQVPSVLGQHLVKEAIGRHPTRVEEGGISFELDDLFTLLDARGVDWVDDGAVDGKGFVERQFAR
ncbi:hypothetical protein PG985_016217 [Apiospora marii]|uniref:Uncharacterized protein n=1 Tax=Apiospora marii TaxID=335849 RepID=A0ABR1SU34_9PEZI